MKNSVVAFVNQGTFTNCAEGTSDLACADLGPAGVSGAMDEELVVISENDQVK